MRSICTAVVATLVLVGTSFAATINVPADQPTIAAAISASVNGDIIAIAAGTYYEHSLNTNNKAITIGSASGNLDVTIDAQQGGSVFVIELGEGAGTVIKDLVITGGKGTDTGGWAAGGGIYCDYSSPTISGCTIEGNTAFSGGGIYCRDASNPTISGCTIDGNTAQWGGGIYCYANNPTISDCMITGNTANNGEGGGIICYNSNPTISGCTIEGNTATSGGGIYCHNSNPAISDCLISSNTANNSGGGIFCDNSIPTISASWICSNYPYQISGTYTSTESCITENCYTCEDDSDADGVPDYLDQCPGEDDTIDTDSDGTPDCADNCPNDPLKIEPGDCGCGESETDIDSDGTPDCLDECPEDPLKTEPGFCGCGTADTNVNGDVDCDGDYDIDDAYAAMANFGIDEAGECAGDTDGNGVVDIEDLLNMMGSWGACP
jgi:parallel beta-helix repeat protein/predicted outer membrane repeat protein